MNRFYRSFFTLLIVAISGAMLLAQDSKPPLQGQWQVDVDQTVDYTRKYADLSETESERLPDMVERLARSMTLEVNGDKMTISRGERSQSYGLQFKDSKADQVVATFQAGDMSIELTFHFIDEDHMRYTSSATDDMDYYIWKRSEK